jgi:hypothetical protein
MSGSPIFIDGKMVGAYAYGWYFGMEPIAGVTPIESMLADMRRPLPPSLAPRGGRSPIAGAPVPARPLSRKAEQAGAANRFLGSTGDYDARKHAGQIAARTSASLAPPHGSGLAPASTTLLMGGLSTGAFQLARELFEPAGFELLQAGTGGGGGKATTPARFEEGGVLAVQLVRGDVSASGLGTVTHVVGDKVLGFGHPMLGGGFEDLPTATGVVHWVLATQNRSFKIGEPAVPLGSLINDRQSAVVIDTSRTAPTFPVTVQVTASRAPRAPIGAWRSRTIPSSRRTSLPSRSAARSRPPCPSAWI